jgi:hypothetical protein
MEELKEETAFDLARPDSGILGIARSYVEESREPLLVMEIAEHLLQRFPWPSRHIFGGTIS